MSYTVKTPKIVALIEKLNAISNGTKYRVIRCTEWDNFQLQKQVQGVRGYEHVFDSDLEDVTSTIVGMLKSDTKVESIIEVYKTVENAFNKARDNLSEVSQALLPEYVVLHGGVIGLYVSPYTYEMGSFNTAKLFADKDTAHYVANKVFNGNNTPGKVENATMALSQECQEMQQSLEYVQKVNPWLIYM